MSDWDFACPDWADRLKAGKTLLPDLPLDQKEAARALGIFNKLKLPDVPGQPTLAKAAGEWQRDIVRATFGSLGADGRRMVPELFVMVPKKSSKTTCGAAVMITALLMNKRPRAEFLLIGPTQDIADTAYQQAVGMIEADPYLKARFNPVEHRKMIVDRDRAKKARLRIKTFDMKVMTGAKPAGVLIDEMHIMGSMHFASRVVGQIRGGLMPNPEGFMIIITTQSDEPKAGVFKVELEYARGVRDGKIRDSRMLPMLYEFPEDMQRSETWRDPANWPMVLPNLGRPVTIEVLQAGYREAADKGDAEEKRWLSQHLNIEIGVATHDGRWIGADYWSGAADKSLTLDALLERCDVVVVGIDGGGLDDLLGLAVLGRDRVSRDWLLWTRAWAHGDVLTRRKQIAPRMLDFERDGDLVICRTETQDIEDVADICMRIKEAGLLPAKGGVGMDPNGVAAIVDALAARGMDVLQNGGNIEAVYQGYRLNGAIKGMERKLKDGTLWHGGSPMMAWCVGNAKCEQRGNAVVIEKSSAGSAKIDPLVAALCAATLMGKNPEGENAIKSPWEDESFRLWAGMKKSNEPQESDRPN